MLTTEQRNALTAQQQYWRDEGHAAYAEAIGAALAEIDLARAALAPHVWSGTGDECPACKAIEDWQADHGGAPC